MNVLVSKENKSFVSFANCKSYSYVRFLNQTSILRRILFSISISLHLLKSKVILYNFDVTKKLVAKIQSSHPMGKREHRSWLPRYKARIQWENEKREKDIESILCVMNRFMRKYDYFKEFINHYGSPRMS